MQICMVVQTDKTLYSLYPKGDKTSIRQMRELRKERDRDHISFPNPGINPAKQKEVDI